MGAGDAEGGEWEGGGQEGLPGGERTVREEEEMKGVGAGGLWWVKEREGG